MLHTTINGYTIQTLLGKGGMAEVYYAENRLHKRAAIKVLRSELESNDDIRQRFVREAETIAFLEHPNIRQVFDMDHAEGRSFIIMEYLEGMDLKQYMKKHGAVPEPKAVAWVCEILKGLHYAHTHGVVHRDIKPANIFLTDDGKVKLMDFGIAKVKSEGLGLTGTNTRMGTPIFMSPEQIRTPKAVDHRTDIYSMGVTLWTLLNGKPPYDDQVESEFELMNTIVTQPLPPLSHVSVNVSRAILLATAKDTATRLSGCNEMAEALGNKEVVASAATAPAPAAIDGERTVVDTLPKEQHVPKQKVERITPDEALGAPKSNGDSNAGAMATPAATPPERKKDRLPLLIGLGAAVLMALAGWWWHERSTTAPYVEDTYSIDSVAVDTSVDTMQGWSAPADTTLQASMAIEAPDAPPVASTGTSSRPTKPVAQNPEPQRPVNNTLPAPVQKLLNDMVRIAGGSFMMGCSDGDSECSNDEKPAHRVTVSSFSMGSYEVTQAQWRAVMGSNPSYNKGCGNCPVEQVSWNDIVNEFIPKLNHMTGRTFRLPTEAEWEYAARGGTTTRFLSGNCLSTSQANYDGNYPASGCGKGEYRGMTILVGRVAPNNFGLYDMSGNVWELCADDWHGSYSGAPTDGRAWVGSPRADYRVIRGGSYMLAARNCRMSDRLNHSPDYRANSTIGFRLVLQ